MISELNKEDYIKILDLAKYIKPNFELKDFSLVDNIIVYMEGNMIVGFLEYYVSYETLELLNIAVEPSYQNRGIASALIKYLCKMAGINRIILEVRESNKAALSLYQKLGFKVLRTIKNYYGNEQGYAMEWRIK